MKNILTIKNGGGYLFTSNSFNEGKWGERYLISTHFGDVYV